MTTTLAVVPEVLGRPVNVFGHSAEGKRHIVVNHHCSKTLQNKMEAYFHQLSQKYYLSHDNEKLSFNVDLTAHNNEKVLIFIPTLY